MNTQEEVLKWLINHKIKNFSINEDLTVDVQGDVSINAQNIVEFPIQFGVVTGTFNCAYSKLKSLKGVPKFLDGSFICGNNPLKSLLFSPQEIGGDFDCHNTELLTLEGGPIKVGGDYDCRNSYLSSLKGAPKLIQKNFNVFNNSLTSLKYCPEVIIEDFICSNNELTDLIESPLSIGGNFDCLMNDITTLNNFKTIFKGEFLSSPKEKEKILEFLEIYNENNNLILTHTQLMNVILKNKLDVNLSKKDYSKKQKI